MINAISTSDTALQSAQTWLDVIANNLANLNTTAFKENRVTFADLLYFTLHFPDSNSGGVIQPPTASQQGYGVFVSSADKLFSNGALQSTSRNLDVAIEGNGFFQVTFPDGRTGYTRDGAFSLAADGTMLSSSGLPVQPTIVIPPDTLAISISSNGTVSVTRASAPNTLEVLGQLSLARFTNTQGLKAQGDNLFLETAASGPPTVGTPGTEGLGSLHQDFLEGSNVDAAVNLTNLILAQNMFTINTRVLTTSSEMLQTTFDLLA